jgi:phage terminase large subunit-like protein
MCAGVGTNLTGLHFDYIKISDLVNKDSVANDTQIQASKDYYAYLRPLFDKIKVPREDVEGTFYHFNDLNCALNKSEDFEKSIIPAIKDGQYMFPERIDQEAIDLMLNDPTIGPMMVYPQILLKPFDPAKSKFKREWVKDYETIPEGLAEYICIDPASTQKKKSDYTVIEKWGIDAEGNHYLLDGIRDKLTIFQRIAEIVRMVKSSKRLCAVKYEVLGGRHGDLEALKEAFRKENLPVIPQETKSVSTSKKDRIEQRLVNQFFCGRIYLPKSVIYRSIFDGKTKDFVGEYLLEYLQFPFTEHDDILDCHSQMFEEPHMLARGLTAVVKRDTRQTAQDLENYYNELDNIQTKNPFLTREQAFNKRRNNAIRHVLMRI